MKDSSLHSLPGLCAGIFIVSFIVRLLLMFIAGSYLQAEDTEPVRIAISLARYGTFSDAYGNGMGPTAHAAPIYPLLLSAVFRVFGEGQAGSMAQEILSCALASLQYALLPVIARECFLDPRVGAVAGLLASVLPINRWVQTKGSFEYSLAALLLITFSLVVLRVWNRRSFSVPAGVGTGVVTGIGLLTYPTAAPLFVAILLCGFIVAFRSATLMKYAAFCLAQLLTVLVLLAPWISRNQKVLGAPVWTRSNAGMELSLSNNDRASAVWDENMANGLFRERHPYYNGMERQRILIIGEVAYNREKLQTACDWISRHPGRFSLLTIERAGLFWFPRMKRSMQTAALTLVTVAGFVGVALFVRPATHAAWYFALLWLTCSAPASIFQMSARFRYPIEWSIFLFAGYALYRIDMFRRGRGTTGPQIRSDAEKAE